MLAGIRRVLPVFAESKNPTPVAARPCRQRAVCSTFRIPPIVLLELASNCAQPAAALRDHISCACEECASTKEIIGKNTGLNSFFHIMQFSYEAKAASEKVQHERFACCIVNFGATSLHSLGYCGEPCTTRLYLSTFCSRDEYLELVWV